MRRHFFMTIDYRTRGVCSTRMVIDVEGDTIQSVKIFNGCDGNLQGISRLIDGMDVDEAIKRLDGIRCGFKATSCPDQLAKALKEAAGE